MAIRSASAAGTAEWDGTGTAGRVVFWLLVAVVALAPLPFGSNRPWFWAPLGVAVGVLVLGWAVAATLGRRQGPPQPGPLRLAALLYGAVCLWALVQYSSWTPGFLHHPVWAEASRALGVELAGRISATPHETLHGLVRLLTYAGAFWLAYALGRDQDRARLALHAVAWAVTLYAVYGIAMLLGGEDRVLGYERTAYHNMVTGTFINRNHFATYAAFGLIVATALLLDRLGASLAQPMGLGIKVARVVGRLLGPQLPLAAAASVLGLALLMTGSRAGGVAAAVGMATLLLLLAMARTVPWPLVIGVSGLLGAATMTLAGIGYTRSMHRIGGIDDALDLRLSVYARTLDGIGQHPLLGTGLGSFEKVFPAFRDRTVDSFVVFDKAHNSYLENMLELGVPMALALFIAVGTVAWLCLRGVRTRRRGQYVPAAALACLATGAAHSIGDFSLQIPAVALTLAFLLGLGCAQSQPSERRRRRRPPEPSDEGAAAASPDDPLPTGSQRR